MKAMGASLLLAALACAQTYEIRGTVTEPGIGGVAGITIRVRHLDPPAESETTTDARGTFRVVVGLPGAYMIERVGGPTYAADSEPNSSFVQLDAANPRAEVQFTVVRPGQITGLVLDEETREPSPDSAQSCSR